MRRESPAALRNWQPIREVLSPWMSDVRRLLEVPCGSGVHTARLSASFPEVDWLPADIAPEAIASTKEWLVEGSARVKAPRLLDVTDADWRLEAVDMVLAVNLIHAAPPPVTPGLLSGSARHLNPGGWLVLYGPFREEGALSESNQRFEREYLQQRDPTWGIRELSEVSAYAQSVGLRRVARVEMPANNLMVAFRREEVP